MLGCTRSTGINGGAYTANGEFHHTVIPHFFEVDDFPFCDAPADYYLYCGRLVDRKGIHIASEVCKATGKRLIIAGSQGTPPRLR